MLNSLDLSRSNKDYLIKCKASIEDVEKLDDIKNKLSETYKDIKISKSLVIRTAINELFKSLKDNKNV